MHAAHSIKLYPTESQKTFFRKSCGVARFSYNWALTEWKRRYEAGEDTGAYTIIKHLNSIKKSEFPWMQETGKTCSQYAIHNLADAFKRFFKKTSKYPVYKKKGCKDSFIAVENKENFKLQNNKLWIPRLGWVRCAENLRFEGKVNYVAIKRVANMWFAVVNVNVNTHETPVAVKDESQVKTVIGVDMGIKTMLVCSNGDRFENHQALAKNEKSLKRLQRSLSRKVKGSSNRNKARIKLARKHHKIKCLRDNSIHQATSKIVGMADTIIIEDLNVVGLLKNKNLSKALRNISFGEIARQLQYKAEWSGKKVIVADRWFASSKICSCCGNKKEDLKLSDRVYHCDKCGLSIDRDLNAAKNLAAYRPTPKSGECEACGEGSSGEFHYSPSRKQEVNKLL